jgi:hypothetical protein
LRENGKNHIRESSKLKRIGERAFAQSGLASITIPASTEEIDGTASVGCPYVAIRIGPGSENFKTERDFLLTSDGTELVRFFGRGLELIVPATATRWKISCFEERDHVEILLCEDGSKLRIIGRSALAHCRSLRSISIPASVEIIEASAFKKCTGLESCIIADKANVVRIEKEAFSKCFLLRSVYIPLRVEAIRENCFKKCRSLHLLRFVPSASLKTLIGDLTLDEAMEKFGLYEISSRSRSRNRIWGSAI